MKFLVTIFFLSISLKLALAGGPGGACSALYDLYDNQDNYIKTLCSVLSPTLIQPDMSKYCMDNGMRLLTISGEEDGKATQKAIKENLPKGWSYYLDTVRTDGVWNPLLNDAVKPIDDKEKGACISAKGEGPYETGTCDNKYTFLCEFDNMD